MAKKRRANWYDACTFQGLGPRKDQYAEKLEEKLVSLGLQKFKEVAGERAEIQRRALYDYFAGSDLIYNFPKLYKIGFVFRPINGDLLVGYLLHGGISVALKLFPIALIVIILNFIPDWFDLPSLPFLLAALVLGIVGIFYLFYGGMIKPYKQLIKPVEKILVEVAESMGGKQLTPFKRTKIALQI